MTELEQYVASHFEIVQPGERRAVIALFTPVTLKKGGYFLKEGKESDKFCFIKSGHLRVFAIFNGEEITQWIAAKGQLGTDSASFFFQQPSRWTIQALDNTELFVITKENYNKIRNAVT